MSKTGSDLLKEQGALAPDVVAVRAGGALYDLLTPIPNAAANDVTPIRATDEAALPIIRHSTSHVMADAVQKLFPGTKVAFGPATDNGFYYDLDRKSGAFSEEDLRAIEAKMAEIIATDAPFRREVVSVPDARKILGDLGETFKLEHLERLAAQGEEISVYRHGDWIDLCEGPHVPSTRFLRAFKLTSVAGAYWRGDERNPMLQRIHGTAFASQEALEKHLKDLEEAKARDHRKLGKELDLVAFHPWAPASPFFLPRGARVYNGLVDYMRAHYETEGYEEVITPQIFDNELFRTSQHLPTYAENMYLAATLEDFEKLFSEVEKMPAAERAAAMAQGLRYGVKPMNCPGHATLFGMRKHSYRELPFRMADFGRLHRFERSGVVQGMTRVRSFAQDDAHIFCAEEQVHAEIGRFLDFIWACYRDFGFADVRLVLATRPNLRAGSDEVWDRAEKVLEDSLKQHELEYTIAEGEGAFYGPKLEFHLKDAIGRPWQIGTMQADYNLPEFFDLQYVGEDNKTHRPVMLHRAIIGSVERFFGILIEHVGGAFPTWLAPEQITLLTVSEKFNDYAREAMATLRSHGIRATADLSSDKLGAKIRQARLMRVPYLGVIGGKEVEAKGVALRSRDEDKDLGLTSLDDVIARIGAEQKPPSLRK
jgi:threonyl-tRNA synthetase